MSGPATALSSQASYFRCDVKPAEWLMVSERRRGIDASPKQLVHNLFHGFFLPFMSSCLCKEGEAPNGDYGRAVDLCNIAVGATFDHRDVNNAFDGILQQLRTEASKLRYQESPQLLLSLTPCDNLRMHCRAAQAHCVSPGYRAIRSMT